MGLMKGVKNGTKKYLGKAGDLKEKAETTSKSVTEELDDMKEVAQEKLHPAQKVTGKMTSLKEEAHDLKKVFQSKDLILVKTDAIAIVLRKVGALDEFLATVDKVTKEGYRLVLREEVRDIPIPVAGFKIPTGTFYYFQHIKYITQ